ncbi:MAG: alpha-hydroxy acid oxidase [Pseudomonadota bacterium]
MLDAKYPAISDLRARAQARVPRFVWDYLDSATGVEAVQRRNRAALDRVGFMPSILHGPIEIDTSVDFLGQRYPMPVGMAPVGMSGLIWPGAERMLAAGAARLGIPYGISTVAAAAPEDLSNDINGSAWFQMYPPKHASIRTDMLERAKRAGFDTLVLTVDVPVASRRERQTRSGLTSPPRLTPRLMAQVAMRPAWALATARAGMPRMRMLDAYTPDTKRAMSPTAHAGYMLRTSPDWSYVDALRAEWDKAFIIKGVMRGTDAKRLEECGVDAVWVSTHAGRQFDGGPGAIEVLPEVRDTTSLPLVFDSGVEGGLDVLRALALGADFVMLGRAWHYAVAALGAAGIDHLGHILRADLKAQMGHLGMTDLSALPEPIVLSEAGG